jgi:hypothetical protein
MLATRAFVFSEKRRPLLAELVDDCTSPHLAGAISGVRFADFLYNAFRAFLRPKKFPRPVTLNTSEFRVNGWKLFRNRYYFDTE